MKEKNIYDDSSYKEIYNLENFITASTIVIGTLAFRSPAVVQTEAELSAAKTVLFKNALKAQKGVFNTATFKNFNLSRLPAIPAIPAVPRIFGPRSSFKLPGSVNKIPGINYIPKSKFNLPGSINNLPGSININLPL